MILTLVGVSEGTLSDAAQRSRRVGADIVIRPPNSSILSFSYGFSAGLLRFVEEQPHVQSAAGILVQPLNGFGNSVNGLDLQSFNRLSGGFHLINGRVFKRDDELMADTKAVIATLKSKLNDYPIYSMEELIAAMTVDNVPMLRPFINLVIGIAVLVGFLVVFQCMYTAVLERTRDIGTLKALGASQSYILNVLLRESAMMTVAGAILGILSTYATRSLISRLPTPLIQEIVPSWWPIAFALALFGGLLGSLYPGLKAANQDVIESLSYD
jgi:putative ABC transport system permease protein